METVKFGSIISPSKFFFFPIDSKVLPTIKLQENEMQKDLTILKKEFTPKAGDVSKIYHVIKTNLIYLL